MNCPFLSALARFLSCFRQGNTDRQTESTSIGMLGMYPRLFGLFLAPTQRAVSPRQLVPSICAPRGETIHRSKSGHEPLVGAYVAAFAWCHCHACWSAGNLPACKGEIIFHRFVGSGRQPPSRTRTRYENLSWYAPEWRSLGFWGEGQTRMRYCVRTCLLIRFLAI